MAVVNGSLELGYKNLAWFNANPTLVLKEGQIVYLEQTGTYKIGNGVSTLSALSFLGVSSETQTLQNVTDLGSTTTNSITANGFVKTGGTSSQFLKANGSVDSTTYLSTQVVPVGGTTGQILAKVDDTDYNLEWIENYANYTSTLKHTVKASVAVTKGQAVYVSGASGTNMLVSKASNASEATSSKTLGLVAQDLAINGQGFVITEGLLSNINTNSATIGDPVWLGVDGALIYGLASKPYAPAHLVFIGIVTRVSATVGEIFVKVQNGFELNEIHDVDLKTTLPSNNEILTFESSTSLWKNKSVISALGFTPYNSTNPSNYISGITSGMVTTALGFTPYNSTNPSGYITGITSGNVTTALGYTPVNDGLPKMYHSLKWFTPSGNVSSSGTTVTSVGTQFTSGMVNAKLTISGESKIITAFISTTQVTVASPYSTNYSGITPSNWGVYNIAYEITNAGFQYFYGYNSNNVGGYERVRIGSDLFCYENTSLSNYWQLTGVIKGLGLNNDGKVAWSSTNNVTQTKDLGLWRNTAGVLEINDGSTVATGLLANRRDLLVRNVKASSLTLDLAPFTITGSNNTLQTASTAVVGINYLGGTRQWNTGNIGTQSENVWGATTYSFVGASTITNAYGNVFNAPVAGTNCTITNNWAAQFNGNVVIGSTGQLIEIKQTTNAPTYTQTGATSSVFTVKSGTRSLVYESYASDNNYISSVGAKLGISAPIAGISFFIASSEKININSTSFFLLDSFNLQTGTTTGTKIATATTQKIGFWNATPIVQPTTSVTASTFVSNTSMILNDTATFDGYTIGQVVKALRNMGLLA